MSVVFSGFEEQYMERLKLFNAAMFPVKYSSKFYDTVRQLPDFTRLAVDGDELVGAVCCRSEMVHSEDKGDEVQLYIMTIGVLPTYRRHSIASMLLYQVMAYSQEVLEPTTRVYLHVQISNESAISLYQGIGFVNSGTIENYYKRIDPPHCNILERQIQGLAEVIAARLRPTAPANAAGT